MTRILLVETASPKRVRKKAEEILERCLYTAPDLTILCRPEAGTVQYLGAVPGARIVPFEKVAGRDILRDLRRSDFDVVWMFWTCERNYLDMKWTALWIPALFRNVDIGDGHTFKLTPGNLVRYLGIRLKHRRPSDSDLFQVRPAPLSLSVVPPENYDGEKVLIIQSARPEYILRAMDSLSERPLFLKPRYTLFCRDKIEIVAPLERHPILYRIVTHSETKGAWKHLRAFRRERFDAVLVFFTGDPSYWKIKYFAFLLGARHKVIFNESNDCYYFSVKSWLTLMSLRRKQQRLSGGSAGAPPMSYLGFRARVAAIYFIKILLLPPRFLWLLLNWARLRLSSLRETT